MKSSKEYYYSPNRLALAKYCGTSAKHSRYRGGSPSTKGLEFGSLADNDIYKFFKSGVYTEDQEYLDYVIYNTPSPDECTPSEEIDFQIQVDEYNVRIFGFTDLSFPTRVVEIKTGVEKAWHQIQALCYAVYKKVPCQIIYVTRFYHITVEPDEELLKNIIRTAIHNEDNNITQKCEHCQFCVLKSSCSAWNAYSPIVKLLSGYHETIKYRADLTPDMLKILTKQFKEAKETAKELLDPNITYTYDGYQVTISTRATGKKGITITDKLKKSRELNLS